MPTNFFFTINLSFSILAAFTGLLTAFLTTTIIYIHRPCHTVANLIQCNTLVSMIVFMILVLISAIHGLREDWTASQFACSFRAYCYTVMCMIICCSYAVQAISRLFYAVLYRYRFLQTWRVHWILIVASWMLSFLVQTGPFVFDKEFYGFELESRVCLGTTNRPLASLYSTSLGFLIPVSILTGIYVVIIRHVRQSSLRIHAFATNRNGLAAIRTISSLSMKRELKLMKTVMLLMALTACSGTLYLILLVWHLGQWSRPPEWLYLLSINRMVLGVSAMTIIIFFINKEMKNFLIVRLRKLR